MSKQQPRKWTPAEIDELKQLAGTGLGIKEIARRMGRTYKSVEQKASKLQISITDPIMWTEAELAKLRKLISEGQSTSTIAKYFNKTPAAIRSISKKLGLKIQIPNKWSEADTQLLLDLNKNGYKVTDIARILNRSLFAVNARLQYIKYPLKQLWYNMLKRTRHNHNYIAKNITVCERWLDFDNFEKDITPIYIPGLTLDRIDSSKNYSPDNVRFSNRSEQAKNRLPWSRKVPHSEHNRIRELAVTHSQAEIATMYAVSPKAIRYILKKYKDAA